MCHVSRQIGYSPVCESYFIKKCAIIGASHAMKERIHTQWSNAEVSCLLSVWGEECRQKCRVVTEINPFLKTFHKI